MRKQIILALSVVLPAVILATGCSSRKCVAVTVPADRGPDPVVITTNGYTMVIGKTTIDTNAVVAPKPSP